VANIEKITSSQQGSILIMKTSEVIRIRYGNFSELETELGQGNHVIQARRLAAKENLSIWVGT